MSSSQPAGWYPDASLPGYERWWDGVAWSPVTRAAPAAGEAPSALTGPGGDQGGPGAEQPWGTSASSDPGAGAAPAAPEAPAPSPAPSWGVPGGGADRPANPYAAPSGEGAAGYPPPPAPGQYGQQPPAGYGPAYGDPGAPPPAAGQYGSTPYGAAPQYGSYGSPPYGSAPYGSAPYGSAPPDAAGGGELAGRGARLVARIVDAILVGIVAIIVGLPFLRDIVDAFREIIDSIPTDGGPAPDSTSVLTDPAFTAAIFKYSLVQLAVSGIYHVSLIALRGATLGKSLLGVKVQTRDGGGKPSWVQALLRWATTDLPGLIPNVGGLYSLLDALWCTWDKERQCVHDKLPKTVVVRSR